MEEGEVDAGSVKKRIGRCSAFAASDGGQLVHAVPILVTRETDRQTGAAILQAVCGHLYVVSMMGGGGGQRLSLLPSPRQPAGGGDGLVAPSRSRRWALPRVQARCCWWVIEQKPEDKPWTALSLRRHQRPIPAPGAA